MPDDRHNELKALYRRVFAEGEGSKVLEHLVGKYHDRSIHVAGGIEGQRETEKRAAQKDVIGYILAMCAVLNETESEDAEAQ